VIDRENGLFRGTALMRGDRLAYTLPGILLRGRGHSALSALQF
jgi:hypothetical protein